MLWQEVNKRLCLRYIRKNFIVKLEDRENMAKVNGRNLVDRIINWNREENFVDLFKNQNYFPSSQARNLLLRRNFEKQHWISHFSR